ncbi:MULTISPECIES: acyl-CoA carboxylase subunit epsilon [unclassified Mycolicibacterium]|uniref:acyl-CoA carboxylase subunit epsilon n=1 Tax=unclassified Mycolicibacterium TaxID=2636767 RepID=UPI0013063415|nr:MULTISPECIES: acyl-CoA carboxylase subunit epsilon [unclassified Mycolicibacterium]MUL81067.1 acyl-CoA carboxylase subunit epsilon [Mycolicibacterium sp. CBMA 329]MUL86833.1 acyl-CoA carboxylase subunit epsilon [Mycolicibacterium sp. CBMA 331]MUL98882.1 acyl-CoA carboxylase subunit epsilon [Mycolicibacterium sp. CBMA 334]MUM28990.1 acyl-CoA carboxylase subunit epsilon [Mycolicibacterium sp. CBMA 295]MUM37130.1 acyl-CoA carboxylase subunit epsilon [Mycolicibacterium sp. CBMA 247]
MSGASEGTVADQVEAGAEEVKADHEAHIKVLRGQPTDEEMAALMAVLGAAGGGDAGPVVRDRNLWGHPVDKLRYSIFSWQRVTLLERTHLRR